jgi:hypothetical protein
VANESRRGIGAPPADQLEFVITGNPEVVVRGKTRELFLPVDPNAFERIKDDEVQRSLFMILSLYYPPRLAVVRNSSGVWEMVY